MGMFNGSEINYNQKFFQQTHNKKYILNKKYIFNATDMITLKNSKITKHYKIIKVLGNGTYGQVHQAIYLISGQKRAIKIIKKVKNQYFQKKVKSQVDILKHLDHPNIVKLYEFIQDEKYYYIITQLCQGKQLFKKIAQKNISEAKAAFYMDQIFAAINYCHKKGIVHRDLKPQNLIFENKNQQAQLKLIDFGISKILNPNDQLKYKSGTVKKNNKIYYIAPQVINKNYNEKCDIWSAGVILYAMFSGRLPFLGKNQQQILKKIQKGNINLLYKQFESISEEGLQFLQLLLKKDPNQRISAQKALSHNWIQKNKKDYLNKPFLFKNSLNIINKIEVNVQLKENEDLIKKCLYLYCEFFIKQLGQT